MQGESPFGRSQYVLTLLRREALIIEGWLIISACLPFFFFAIVYGVNATHATRIQRVAIKSILPPHTRSFTSTYHMVMGLGAVSFFSLTLTFLQIPPSPLSRCHSSLPPFSHHGDNRKEKHKNLSQTTTSQEKTKGTSPNVGQSA